MMASRVMASRVMASRLGGHRGPRLPPHPRSGSRRIAWDLSELRLLTGSSGGAGGGVGGWGGGCCVPRRTPPQPSEGAAAGEGAAGGLGGTELEASLCVHEMCSCGPAPLLVGDCAPSSFNPKPPPLPSPPPSLRRRTSSKLASPSELLQCRHSPSLRYLSPAQPKTAAPSLEPGKPSSFGASAG